MSIDSKIPDIIRHVHNDPVYQRDIIRKVMIFRYLLGTTALLASFLLKGLPILSWPWLPILCLIFTVSNAAVHFLSRNDTFLPQLFRLLPWFDVGFAPLFFAASGGFISPFSAVFIFAATWSSLLFTKNKNLPHYSFGYLVIGYLGIALLQKPGMFSWNSAWFVFGIGNERFFFTVTVLVVLFMLAVYLVIRHIAGVNVRLAEAHTRSFEEFLDRYKETECRCAHARKMEAIGRITGGITHDFNNTIAAISGYATMLKKKLDDNEQCQSYIRHIIEASKHAAEILERLSGGGKGNHLHQAIQVDVQRAIWAAIAKINEENGSGATIAPTLPPAALCSPGDPVAFQSILAAMLQNARDACDIATGTVTIAAETTTIEKNDPLRKCFRLTEGPYIRVTVADNGRGMSPEVLDRIFEPFFSTKPKGDSAGMSLANVWRYLIDFNGAIDVMSRPGEGSVFHLYLPLMATTVEPVAQVNSTPSVTSSRTVLIVDDEASVREIYSEILNDGGYTTFTAINGAEAIAFLESGHRMVNLVLLDMVMPVMDGSATFNALRKKYPSQKVLFMSGCVDQEKMATILKEPGTAFFQKPCEGEQLISLIESMISPAVA